MHTENIKFWSHSHHFEQDRKRSGELRTTIVIIITGMMMVIEIAAGLIFGSMALLADGLHMASHAAALSITVFAYIYARRFAHDPRFSFGTGKVNALGGFTGAVLLAIFALLMGGESIHRLLNPAVIAFNEAILVAVIGLIINGISMVILGHQDHHHDHGNEHVHNHHDDHDHNLRSAYLHVLADALTSFLAIFALLAAKYFGMTWMDPLMGIVGAIMVSRWSLNLLRTTSTVLLDQQAPAGLQKAVRESIERHDDNRVADLHLWCIGPNLYAAIISVVTQTPRLPAYYKELIPPELGLAHVTIEVHQCPG